MVIVMKMDGGGYEGGDDDGDDVDGDDSGDDGANGDDDVMVMSTYIFTSGPDTAPHVLVNLILTTTL